MEEKKYIKNIFIYICYLIVVFFAFEMWESYFEKCKLDIYSEAIENRGDTIFYYCSEETIEGVDEDKYYTFAGYIDEYKKEEKNVFLVKRNIAAKKIMDEYDNGVMYCKWIFQYNNNEKYQVYNVVGAAPDTIFIANLIIVGFFNLFLSGGIIGIACYSYYILMKKWELLDSVSKILFSVICVISTTVIIYLLMLMLYTIL